MTRYFISLLAILTLLVSSIAAADDDALLDAREKLLAGDYETAMTMGQSLETAEGLSLAAEALSAQVMLGLVERPRKTATRARKLAKDALKLDPDSHNANVQYALARGFEAQNSSPFRAVRKNLISKSRKAIEAVQEKFPGDPRGDALMGAWHLGIVRKAGAGTADDLFNATAEDGIKFYDLALERAPDDIIIMSNYSATLLAIDSELYGDKAEKMLVQVSILDPQNMAETAVQDRMAEFLPHFENIAELEKLGKAWLGDHNDDEDED